MNSKQDTIVKTRQNKKSFTCSLTKEDLRLISDKIEAQMAEALRLEESRYTEQDKSLENYDEISKRIRESFHVSITVHGSNGEEIFGTVSQVFDSPNFPDQVTNFHLFSDTFVKVNCNHTPRNRVSIILDFEKPKLLDFSVQPSMPTPNTSSYEVEGFDSGWVNGVFSEIENFISNRSNSVTFVHNHSVYDFYLWFIGLPSAFYICSKVSGFVNLTFTQHPFLKASLYVYIGYLTLILSRVLFHYARWVFPIVEFESKLNKTSKQKYTLASILLGLMVCFIYDLIQ